MSYYDKKKKDEEEEEEEEEVEEVEEEEEDEEEKNEKKRNIQIVNIMIKKEMIIMKIKKEIISINHQIIVKKVKMMIL